MAGLIERWILENIYCLNAHLDEFFTQLLITDLIFFLWFIGMLVDLDLVFIQTTRTNKINSKSISHLK